MRIPLWLKVGWSMWVLVWAPVYWHQYGLQNFLYFCDLGNLFIAAALWLESPLLFAWQACGLLLFQSLFTIDLIGAVLNGRHIIGGTEYMFDPHLHLFVRLLGSLTTWIVVPINYFWRPEFDVNWARGPFFREQHFVPGILYLAAYLVVVPLAVYWPTHLILRSWVRQFRGPVPYT